MAFEIDKFISTGMAKGGARPNLFKASITTKAGLSFPDFEFMCKASTLPATTIGNVPVPYMGHKYNVPGDISYGGTMDLTVFVDEGLAIRKQFETWMDLIRTAKANAASKPDYHNLMGTVQLDVYGKTQKDNKFSVKLEHAWPQNIGDIALAWDANDQIMEMNVTIQYTYHVYDK
jgi:hypothetical protein